MPTVLAVIIARAGSKGLPNKCVQPLAGRALVEFTFDHAFSAESLDAICFSTDSPEAARLASQRGIFVVDRPAELASDTAPVSAVVRHAVTCFESAHPGFRSDVVVLLYGNIPLRPAGVIDRAVRELIATGADSVRSVAPVSKQHPDWLHRLEAGRLVKFRENHVHRRQDLEPLFYHDGAVVVVTRDALETPPAHSADFHAFFGRDRRGLVVGVGDTVDVDDAADLRLAEARMSLRPVAPVRIGAAEVGPNLPAFIIAEAGVNHDGDVDAARRLIDAARSAGASAVKFQVFAASRLVTRKAAACNYQRRHDDRATSQYEMLRRLELAPDRFAELSEHARQVGIEFLATPFSPADVRLLVELGAPAIKLASTDLLNLPLIDAALETGRPLIVSTGAAEASEITSAVCRLRRAGAVDRLILLHCVSSYPTPPGEANLRAVRALAEQHRVPVGYSDHTREVHTGAVAVAAGAVALEKHLTLDRTRTGPDHFFSLEPADFAAYVRQVRETEALLGDGVIRLSAAQLEVRRLARGCLVAARDIMPGEPLTHENVIVKRAGSASSCLSPIELPRIVGRRAAAFIPADTPLAWSLALAAPVDAAP